MVLSAYHLIFKFYYYILFFYIVKHLILWYKHNDLLYIILLGGILLEKLVINGSTSLKGEVTISGAKNAAVAILPAALLINGKCTIENLPNISDVKISCDILSKLGAKIEWVDAHTITIDTTDVCNHKAPVDMTSKFRASYYLIGSLLSRCHDVEVGLPGGCNLGARPIDQHIKGFEALGANVTVSNGKVQATTDKLIGTSIYLDMVSVGATINVMLAAVLAEGTTTIDNAAKEPEIVNVATFLNNMGAKISGAGTSTIKIEGVEHLHKCFHEVIPDRIEAGTYIIIGALCGTPLKVDNVIPEHVTFLLVPTFLSTNTPLPAVALTVSPDITPVKEIVQFAIVLPSYTLLLTLTVGAKVFLFIIYTMYI